MNLSTTLKQLRAQKGIGQKELAIYLHCSVGTISSYEHGRNQPDLDTLVKLADFYEVSTDYLLGRSNCLNIADASAILISDSYPLNRFMKLLQFLTRNDKIFLAYDFCLLEKIRLPKQE